MTEDDDRVRVPPSFYEPFVPPPPKPPSKWGKVALIGLVVVAVLFAGTLVTFFLKATAGLDESLARDRQQEAAADAALDAALERPADTATVTPGPDGTKPYVSAGPKRDDPVWRVSLPRGWEGRRIAVPENDVRWSDSVLTKKGASVAAVVERFELRAALDDDDFARQLRVAIDDDTTKVTSTYTETTVGLRGPAWYYDAETREADGVTKLRVVVFGHDDGKFRVDLAADENAWPKALEEFEHLLGSWRWGA